MDKLEFKIQMDKYELLNFIEHQSLRSVDHLQIETVIAVLSQMGVLEPAFKTFFED